MPRASASPFANSIPTRSDPTRPGPSVTATASIWSTVSPAVSRACWTTRGSSVMWARDASSGTTPPYSTWMSCAATMLARMRPSWTMAAPVSSQEVSIPRIRMTGLYDLWRVPDPCILDGVSNESQPRSALLRYAFALLAVVAAVLLRILLDPLLGSSAPFFIQVGAIAAAVWIGGFGPALVAAVLGYLA